MADVILYEKQNHISIFRINREEARNALNAQGLLELHDRMIEFEQDTDAWVGIVTGVGKEAFCGGADIKEMLSFQKEHPGQYRQRPDTPMRGMVILKPLIAAINGLALGGGLEIALACDLRVVSSEAIMGTPEANLSLIPGWGATQRLPRMIPWVTAAEILLTAKPISADKALQIGLVNRVVLPQEVMDTALKIAADMIKLGPLALQAIKQAMIEGTSSTLEQGLQIEKNLVERIVATDDFAEGIRAFVEKRKPDFKGK
jgi:enoyl-CoA hydratase/carnithine racemase